MLLIIRYHVVPSKTCHAGLFRTIRRRSRRRCALSRFWKAGSSLSKNGMSVLRHDIWGNSDLCLDATERIDRDPLLNRVNGSLTGDVVFDEFDVMVLLCAVNRCWEIGCQKILIWPGEYEGNEESALNAPSRRQRRYSDHCRVLFPLATRSTSTGPRARESLILKRAFRNDQIS